MKVSVIGAAGQVGSSSAFALMHTGVVGELVLVDVFMNDQVTGEAEDMLHGTPLIGPVKVSAGGYDATTGSDVIVISSGVRRRPEESRLDLINRNVQVFRSILGELKTVGLRKETILCIISNPVDVLTYIAAQESGLPSDQVVGTGTWFDTGRLRSLVARHFGVNAAQVDAMMLGEHGDSMVPAWSRATVGGVPISALPGHDQAAMDAIAEETRTAGARMIKLKGGARWGIGQVAAAFVTAVALDGHTVAPLSTVQSGVYGLKDVALSVPSLLGRTGVAGRLEMPLSEAEMQGLRNSARVLRETLNTTGV